MKTPCAADPELWFSTDMVEKGKALHICLEHCPLLKECSTVPPLRGAVLAGVAYSDDGKPLRANRRPLPVPCVSCSRVRLPARDTGRCGTDAGYFRHRYLREDSCQPCRSAHSAAVVARKRPA